MAENPISGKLFVFVNKRCTLMKVLQFDLTGYRIWSKRLEQGRFGVRESTTGKRLLDWLQLKLFLEGIEFKKICNTSVISTHR